MVHHYKTFGINIEHTEERMPPRETPALMPLYENKQLSSSITELKVSVIKKNLVS